MCLNKIKNNFFSGATRPRKHKQKYWTRMRQRVCRVLMLFALQDKCYCVSMFMLTSVVPLLL